MPRQAGNSSPTRGANAHPRSRSRSTSGSGDKKTLRLYLLDVGTQQYGDCILCELGGRFILVDGGHPSDFRGTTGHKSIPAQLEKIFGRPALFPLIYWLPHTATSTISAASRTSSRMTYR